MGAEADRPLGEGAQDVAGEASGREDGGGSPCPLESPPDEPQGDRGVAATPSPPLPPSLKRVKLLASRVGTCLHYLRDGVLIRENLTPEYCASRVAALSHDPAAAAVWSWKLEQIEQGPTT